MPWVSAVFPAPSGPTRTTRSPGRSSSASARPSAWVSSGVGSTCSRFTAALPRDGAAQVGEQRRPRRAVRPEPDRRRRVVGRPHRRARRPGCAPAAHLAQHRPRAEEPLRRRQPQRHDDRRVEQLELAAQPAAAARHLGRLRRPVARRPALHHVEDGALRAVEARLGQQLVEQRTGPPDERPARLVLGGAGRLADQHQPGPTGDRDVADDDVLPGGGELGAGDARAGDRGQRGPVGRGGGDPGDLVGRRRPAGAVAGLPPRHPNGAIGASAPAAGGTVVEDCGTPRRAGRKTVMAASAIGPRTRRLRHRLPRRRARTAWSRPRSSRSCSPGGCASTPRASSPPRPGAPAPGRGRRPRRRRPDRAPLRGHDPLAAGRRRPAARHRRPAAPRRAARPASAAPARPPSDGPTIAGRRVLHELGAEPPLDDVAPGTDALQVALHGREGWPDHDPRAEIFVTRAVRPFARGSRSPDPCGGRGGHPPGRATDAGPHPPHAQ